MKKISTYLILVFGFIISISAYWFSVENIQEQTKLKFHTLVQESVIKIYTRMDCYNEVLYSGVGLFNASNEVSKDEWHTFTSALKLKKRFPGIQGFGFSKVLQKNLNEKQSIITSIAYLEPENSRNARAMGYDMYSQETRREAMDRAIDSLEVATSGKVRLLQENDIEEQAGFLIYVPVFKSGLPLTTYNEKITALTGFVYAPFRVNDLMEGILGEQQNNLSLIIYDNAKLKENILYQTSDIKNDNGAMHEDIELNVNGRKWILCYTPSQKFLQQENRNDPLFILIFGLTVTLGLYLYIQSIIKRKELAQEVADNISSINVNLSTASKIAKISFWEFDSFTNCIEWSDGVYDIFEIDDHNEKIDFQKFIEFIPLDEREILNNSFQESILEEKEYRITHTIITRKGNKKYVEEKGIHYYNDGVFVKTLGNITDITDQKKLESLYKTIIEQSKKFEKLFTKFDENVIASTTDLKGEITFVTNAFCEISGYSKEELLGSNQNIVRHQDTPKELFNNLWKTIKNGDIWRGTFKNKKKNGDIYWVDAIIYPEISENGKITGYSAIRHNITAKYELEIVHNQINSSIEFASIIQQTILPNNLELNSIFSDNFIYYKPKDVVGGDIYFIENIREKETLILIIDCTGHGVPGALLTMLVKAIERQILQKVMMIHQDEVSPAQILYDFHKLFNQLLTKTNKNIKNIGFDGGAFYINHNKNIVKFAGARNNLVYRQDNQIHLQKGIRKSIGYDVLLHENSFIDTDIAVKKGMRFYLYTDGYSDQLDDIKKVSFGEKRLLELIENTVNLTLQKQKEILIDSLDNYKNTAKQTDDITLIALEI